MRLVKVLVLAGMAWVTTAWYGDMLVDSLVTPDQESCQAAVEAARANVADLQISDCVAVNGEGAGNVFGAAGLESLDSVQSGGE